VGPGPRRLALLLAVVALAAHVPAAAASPSKEFDDARAVFRTGRYKDAIPKLTGLLYPQSRLSESTELAEAHLLLGVAYYETGDRGAADRELEAALALDPTLEISTATFSRGAVSFFEQKRGELDRKGREEEARLERARRQQLKKRITESAFVLEKRNYLINFVPFGAGQFQNGERGKAIFFAVTEGSLGTVSLGLFAYQLLRYSNGRVPVDEVEGTRNLQVAQITSGALFFGFMAWGIIDSLAHYEHTVRRELDPATLHIIDEYLDETLPGARGTRRPPTPPRPAPRPPKSSLRLAPTLAPDGAGVSVKWEF
jgi:tetratricopeptide (TPR) repeat protein